MSAPIFSRLQNESGQTLVFVAVALMSLVLLLGLVIDLGSFTRAKHHAQAAATAAALAGAEQLTKDPAIPPQTVTDYVHENWPDADVHVTSTIDTLSPSSKQITVVVNRHMADFFAGLGVTVHGSATARAEVPGRIKNASPIALECKSGCAPWGLGETDTFTFDAADPTATPPPGSRVFGPAKLQNVTADNFADLVRCDPQAPTALTCNDNYSTDTPAPIFVDRLPALDPDPVVAADELRSALLAAGPGPHLVAIYDLQTSLAFHIVGWAAFTIAHVSPPGPPPGTSVVTIEGTFAPLWFVGSNSLTATTATPPPAPTDFGVRALGLVG